MPPPRGELQAAAAAAVLQLHVVAREQYTGILKNIMPFSVLKYLVVRQPARFRKESQQPGVQTRQEQSSLRDRAR